MTVRTLTFLFVIFLVIFLSRPEFTRSSYFRLYIVTFFLQFIDQLHSGLFLLIIQKENAGPVLRAYIGPLSIELCKIVCFKKKLRQLIIACFRGIINHLDRFGMARLICADLLICRIIHMSAGISNRRRNDTGDFLK